MDYGICNHTLVPVRIQPDDKYEMINQLLFGDLIVVKDAYKNWSLIESADDQYDGWVDSKQIAFISHEKYNELLTLNRFYTKELSSSAVSSDGKSRVILTLGSRLPSFENEHFKINDEAFIYKEATYHANSMNSRTDLVNIAQQYLDAPYLWGGRSPFGIDCSGLIQVVFKIFGKYLPRDSSQQVLQGNTVDFIHEAREGDLAFFGEEEGNIVHVGIILKDHEIIHASGKVRVDKIDHQGIFSTDQNKYTHKLRIIKSLF